MSDDEKKKFAFVGKENEKADTVVLRTNAEDKENGLEHIHIGSRMKASPGTAKIDINYNYNAKTGHISDYGFSIKGAALRVNYGENENDRPVILGSTERVDVPKEPAGNGTERKDIKSQDLLRDDVDRKLATHELASAGLSKEVMAQALAAVDKNLPALGAPMNISSKSSLGIG